MKPVDLNPDKPRPFNLHRETMTAPTTPPHVLSTLVARPGVCLFCDRPYRAGMSWEACPSRAPLSPGIWQHSGPCVYCSHGPLCVRCEISPDGPVCFACAQENTRAEIAADPYFQADNYAMFGDDE